MEPLLDLNLLLIHIVRQIAELETAGIIEKSSSPYYSQVLMVPKPV